MYHSMDKCRYQVLTIVSLLVWDIIIILHLTFVSRPMTLALLYVRSLETPALREWSRQAPWPYSFFPGAPWRDLSCWPMEYLGFPVQQRCTLRSTACEVPTSAVGWSRWVGQPHPLTLSGSFRISRLSSSLLGPAMGLLWLPIRSVWQNLQMAWEFSKGWSI